MDGWTTSGFALLLFALVMALVALTDANVEALLAMPVALFGVIAVVVGATRSRRAAAALPRAHFPAPERPS